MNNGWRDDTITFNEVDVQATFEIDRETIWEMALDGQMLEDFLDWALRGSTDCTLDQLAAYTISKLHNRGE